MRAISWNVNGRKRRMIEQVNALGARQPDLIALQEVTVYTQEALQELLSAIGLTHTATSLSFVRDSACLTGPRKYFELVASRFPIQPLSRVNNALPWPERMLSVNVESPFGTIELHTVHVPPGSSNGWIKVETLEGIYSALASKPESPRILCGDFNTPQEERSSGEVVTWGQIIGKNGQTRFWKGDKQGTGVRWDAAERNILLNLAHFELPDVFRALHGYGAQQFSWCLKRKEKRVGRRFDHVFAPALLSPISCEYLDLFRETGLSDHSAIEVVFNPKCQLGRRNLGRPNKRDEALHL